MHGGRTIKRLVWGADSEPATVGVVAVHGRGQTPDVMRNFASAFDVPRARFVAPHATGNSWYPHPFLDPFDLNRDALERAMDDIEECIAGLRKEQITRVVVWGFSQGACVLSHMLLSRSPVVEGAALWTGGFVGPTTLSAASATSLSGVKVIMRSIEHDPWVPRHRVDETAAALRAAGAEVNLVVAPGNAHIVTEEANDATARLLTRVSEG